MLHRTLSHKLMTSYQQSFCKTAVYVDVELFIPNPDYEVLNRDPSIEVTEQYFPLVLFIPLSLRVIGVKFLLVISLLYKTKWL